MPRNFKRQKQPLSKGPFNNYGQDEGEGDQKMSVFVHAQGIKTVHAWGMGVEKLQNSIYVVVEWPLSTLIIVF